MSIIVIIIHIFNIIIIVSKGVKHHHNNLHYQQPQRLLCRTLAGNSVHLLTISSPEALEDHKVQQYHHHQQHQYQQGWSTKTQTNYQHQQGKQFVVLTGRVHPGESPSSWMMRGVIQFLTGGCSHHHHVPICSTGLFSLLLHGYLSCENVVHHIPVWQPSSDSLSLSKFPFFHSFRQLTGGKCSSRSFRLQNSSHAQPWRRDNWQHKVFQILVIALRTSEDG